MPIATRGLIIVEVKADDELAISLPVHFKSVKKRKYVLRKKQNKTKQKKEVPSVGVEPRTTCKVNVLTRTHANSNLALTRTKIDFPWISVTHVLLFYPR